jgi:indoleamine 2,3-dioxygenase
MSFLNDAPATTMGSYAPALDAIIRELPTANVLGYVEDCVDALAECELTPIPPGPLSRRALTIMSCLAHSYIWAVPEGRGEIPHALAAPWVALARRCGLPPVLTYSSYVLDNLGLGTNCGVPFATFTGSSDEIWFIRVHQRIERAGAPIVHLARRLPAAITAESDEPSDIETIAVSLEAMCSEARRMWERCDPYIYFHRVRRFLFGWQANPLFRERLMVFQGVDQRALPHGGQYFGESGAQSPLVPLSDALLGVGHKEPFLKYSATMRSYMYPEHRGLLLAASKSAPDCHGADATTQLTRALEALHDFRGVHLDFARRYIVDQETHSDEAVGTGGSFVLAMLTSAREAVAERIRALPHTLAGNLLSEQSNAPREGET